MNWISPLVGEGHAYGPLTATKHVPEDYVQLMGSIFFFFINTGTRSASQNKYISE